MSDRGGATKVADDLDAIKQMMASISELAHKVLARTEVLAEKIDVAKDKDKEAGA